MPEQPGRGPRVVLAKPGLDGHDRGVKVVGMALREAGAEVIYLGLQQTAEQVAQAALAEDADVIGLSILSGVHLAATRDVVGACRAMGVEDIPIVVGGTISARDAGRLVEIGASAVFPAGSALSDVVDGVFALTTAGGPS